MDKLLPCPFCGSETLELDRELAPTGDYEIWFVTCYDCPCQGVHGDTKEEAIEAWNTRTHVSEPIKVNHVIDDSFDDLNNSRGDCD